MRDVLTVLHFVHVEDEQVGDLLVLCEGHPERGFGGDGAGFPRPVHLLFCRRGRLCVSVSAAPHSRLLPQHTILI